MRVVAINEAEAIIEPYWDGGSSEHPTDKMSLLDEYRVTIMPGVHGTVFQQWHAVIVQVDQAPSSGTVMRMERSCDHSIAGYDIFRVFIGMPQCMRMTVKATVDGVEQLVIDHAAGVDTNDEYSGHITGQHLTRLQLEFSLTEAKAAYASLFWLGLCNQSAEARMEARQSPYTPDWPGALQPGIQSTQTDDLYKPQIGIFFDASELDALRRKLMTGHLAPAFDAMREQARKDMLLNPEAEVGRFVPWPMRIFARNRDMKKTLTAGLMERLAFVGLIDRDIDMSIMAARMALSAAHCEYWSESPMGVFPGASWHHRSFTEEIYCRACALVLDWAGFCLTPHGKQQIRDAIIMKGLPRLESDFKRMEYIRHMNQGIVFNSGRVIGMLSLLPVHPRYQSRVEEAERDLHEMIGDYVHPDGGTLEGIAYWNYTFSQSMPQFYALARYHQKTFKQYATPALIKTGDYALGMLSITGDGTTYLPINDAHAGSQLSPGLIAAYCQISDRPEWQKLYASTMLAAQGAPDLYHMILAPEQVAPIQPIVEPKFAVFPDTGQASSVRKDAQIGFVHYHLCSGQAFWGHFDEDKGSFIIEAGQEELAIDRGVSSYDHPEANLMGFASRHNLLYPEKPDGSEMHQPTDVAGARLTSAIESNGIVLLVSNNTRAWTDGLFRTALRRIVSPAPDLYVIDDEIATDEPWAVSFRLHSRCPMESRAGEYWVTGEKSSLRVVPLNWNPVGDRGAAISVLGLESHLKPVNLLRLVSPASTSHRILTAIQVVPNIASPADELWRFDRSASQITADKADYRLICKLSDDPALVTTVTRGNLNLLQATSQVDTWKVA